ncbi:pentatricopeptide repeat-containing protein At1g12775, mitochondrial-like isoform X2 [Ananas comosus]|nr:pentatricopeptide repeat-containing protein At1g12775, mitochondrial-like isoform X2 [Ananas comosus]
MIWTSSSITNLVLCITRRKIGIPLASSYLNAVRSNLDLLSYLILSRAPNTLVLFPLKFHLYSTTVIAPLHNSLETGQHMLNSRKYESVVLSLKNRLQSGRLIDVLNSTSDLNSSLRIFKWALLQKGFHHSAETYSLIILRLGLMGDHQNMEALLREMVQMRPPNLEPMLDQLILSFSQNHKFTEALEVFQHASSLKLRLSLLACNALLRGFVLEGRSFPSFMLVYKEMVKVGIIPDVESLNLLIKVLCGIGRFDLALDQLHRMNKKCCTPNSETFEILIAALCSNDKVDESVKILNEMLERGCTLDRQFYIRVIPIFCWSNKFDEATKLFRMMKDTGLQIEMGLYSMMIQCLCENLMLNDAVGIFEELSAVGFVATSSIYVDIVNGYCKLGKFSEAMSFLDENNVWEIEPYNALLRGLCDVGRFHGAVLCIKKMFTRGLTNIFSWNFLIRGFCNEGNVKSAFEVIARMIVSSFMPEERTYSAVITAYCKMGLLEKALDIFKQAKAKNMCMDSETSSELIEGLCGVKRIEEATEMFYYLTGKGCSLSPWALSMLIQETCLVGKVCEAVKLHSKATSNGIFCTPMAYATIMVGLLNLKKEKDLLPLLAQMFTKGCILDGPTYATIVCSFCTKSTIREGAVLFNKMIHDGFFPDSKMLEMVVFNTTASSLLNKVVHSLIKVINQAGLLNPRICNTIIYGLVKEGYKHEASKFLDQMLENGWVPDPQTHGLLVGNVNLEESDETGESHENYFDDRVSNILAEGLN